MEKKVKDSIQQKKKKVKDSRNSRTGIGGVLTTMFTIV